MVEGGPERRAELFAWLGIEGDDVERRGVVTHVLSHRRMEIDVHAGLVDAVPEAARLPAPYEALAAFDESSLGALGIAKLARKVLDAADDGPLFAPAATARAKRSRARG